MNGQGEESTFILSASRRTDIPAFYALWFRRRLEKGRAVYIHPYTHKRIEPSLMPERVAAIVFWTKNFAPLFDHLDTLEVMGYRRWLVHYTITGLGPEWEPRAPAESDAVMTLRRLSERIGPERIYWRFDPMVFTDRITVAATLDRFARLSRALQGFVSRCYTSIMFPYKKLERRLAAYEARSGDRVRTLPPDEVAELSLGLAQLGRAAGMTVHACCTPQLLGFGVLPGRCLDVELILRLWPDCGLSPVPSPSRKHCACHRAVDLGAYDTCPHLCLYCYANLSPRLIAERFQQHHPDKAALLD